MEKLNDLAIGQHMALTAQESQRIEEEFLTTKKQKAMEVMKKQWNEQLHLKNNEDLVHRVFV